MKKRAFTLVELLVVIAIIALLMSVLMPALAKVKMQARTVACASNVGQLGLAFSMYYEDYAGFYPKGWVNGAWSVGEDLWFVVTKPYYGDKKLLICPSTSANNTGVFGVYRCPADPPNGVLDPYWKIDEQYLLSYTINGYCQEFENGISYVNKWKNANQRNPGNIPVLTDGTAFFQSGTFSAYESPPPYNGWAGGIGRHCIDRHIGFVNVLFMDNSYRKVGLKELWTLQWSEVFNIAGPWTLSGGVAPGMWKAAGAEWLEKFKNY